MQIFLMLLLDSTINIFDALWACQVTSLAVMGLVPRAEANGMRDVFAFTPLDQEFLPASSNGQYANSAMASQWDTILSPQSSLELHALVSHK